MDAPSVDLVGHDWKRHDFRHRLDRKPLLPSIAPKKPLTAEFAKNPQRSQRKMVPCDLRESSANFAVKLWFVSFFGKFALNLKPIFVFDAHNSARFKLCHINARSGKI
jgi:hypothetical protein